MYITSDYDIVLSILMYTLSYYIQSPIFYILQIIKRILYKVYMYMFNQVVKTDFSNDIEIFHSCVSLKI